MAQTILETGTVAPTDTIDSGVEVSVSFSEVYTNPVVVAYIPTRNGGQSISPRVKDVTSTGCTLFTEEPDDEQHNQETIVYWVAEAGEHYTEEGHRVEAGVHTTNTVRSANNQSNFDSVSFSNGWGTAPVTFSTLNTYGNGTWLDSITTNVTTSGFDIAQEAAQSGNETGAVTEDVAWLAIENLEGADTLDGTTFGSGTKDDGTNDGVGEDATTINWSASFSSVPDTIVDQQTMAGGHGSWARGAGWFSDTSHDVYAEEVDNGERSHASERFGWVALPQDTVVVGNPVSSELGSGQLGTGELGSAYSASRAAVASVTHSSSQVASEAASATSGASATHSSALSGSKTGVRATSGSISSSLTVAAINAVKSDEAAVIQSSTSLAASEAASASKPASTIHPVTPSASTVGEAAKRGSQTFTLSVGAMGGGVSASTASLAHSLTPTASRVASTSGSALVEIAESLGATESATATPTASKTYVLSVSTSNSQFANNVASIGPSVTNSASKDASAAESSLVEITGDVLASKTASAATSGVASITSSRAATATRIQELTSTATHTATQTATGAKGVHSGARTDFTFTLSGHGLFDSMAVSAKVLFSSSPTASKSGTSGVGASIPFQTAVSALADGSVDFAFIESLELTVGGIETTDVDTGSIQTSVDINE